MVQGHGHRDVFRWLSMDLGMLDANGKESEVRQSCRLDIGGKSTSVAVVGGDVWRHRRKTRPESSGIGDPKTESPGWVFRVVGHCS